MVMAARVGAAIPTRDRPAQGVLHQRFESVKVGLVIPSFDEWVSGRAQGQVWSTLIASERRQGATTLAGAQMRHGGHSAHRFLRALRPWHNGYRLWSAETSVERERQGTSLRAADSVQSGRTAEDGRHQDRDNVRGAGLGNVYLYLLRSEWRQVLRLPCVEAAPSRWPGEGLDGRSWAMDMLPGTG